jgi:hypothetical protein
MSVQNMIGGEKGIAASWDKDATLLDGEATVLHHVGQLQQDIAAAVAREEYRPTALLSAPASVQTIKTAGPATGKATRLVLVQAAPPHTGSTVVANALQGLVDADAAPGYVGQGEELQNDESCGGSKLCDCVRSNRHVCVVKTYAGVTEAWLNEVDPGADFIVVEVCRVGLISAKECGRRPPSEQRGYLQDCACEAAALDCKARRSGSGMGHLRAIL